MQIRNTTVLNLLNEGNLSPVSSFALYWVLLPCTALGITINSEIKLLTLECDLAPHTQQSCTKVILAAYCYQHHPLC